MVDDQVIKMLHLMFNQLSVPYHQAPGEAEAECARLQQLGIVDAVWSDDGDSFMFGCGTLIKAHKVNGKRVDDSVRIYQASEIFQKHGLDAEGFTLFALLAGGDYDTVGLRGCGPQTAKLLARKDYGLAISLKHVEKRELPAWRQSLADLSRVLGKAVDVPPEFPKWKALEGYRNPKVSDDDQCRNVRALRNDGWNKRIDQVPLRAFLRDYYNFQTREYVKHLGPGFLARALSDVMSPERQRENMVFGVRLKSGRQRKDLSDGKPNPEVKIVFKPRELMEIDLDNAPAEEDWVTPVNASGATHGPPLKAECEMLECFLRHGLPEGSWDPVSKSKKVKSQAGDETPAAAQNNGEVAAVEQTSEASASKKRRRTSEKAPEGEAEKATSSSKKRSKSAKQDDKSTPADSQPGGKASKEASKSAPGKKKSSREVDDGDTHAPPPRFRAIDIPESLMKPRAPDTKTSSQVIDLCDDDEEDEVVTARETTSTPLASHVYEAATSHLGSAARATTYQTSQRASPASKPPLALHGSDTGVPQKSSPPKRPPKTSSKTAQGMSPAPAQASEFVPGEVMDRAKLRELRAAALLNNGASTANNHLSSPAAEPMVRPQPVPPADVIDLT